MTAALVTSAVFASGLALTPPAGALSCAQLFTPEFRSTIAEQFPGQRATAVVHDTRTGCWYHLNNGMQMQTASGIKVQFLAGVLLRAQEAGRPTSQWERDRIGPMISFSHDPPASDLFVSLGGLPARNRSTPGSGSLPPPARRSGGATVSTALDRTRLAVALLHGGGPLAPDRRRAEAWSAMTAVHPTQPWGITAGCSTGSPIRWEPSTGLRS